MVATTDAVSATIAQRDLVDPCSPVVLMVSGGSDSTALAYIASELHARGQVGPLAIMHLNHQLRGIDADTDALFVDQLAQALGIPFYLFEIDIAAKADQTGGNIEAVGRQERYAAANQALERLCLSCGAPTSSGRVFTAHTQNDRVENFYMRSIVGTGPGGFRSMRYLNGNVARPLLDTTRDQLRDYLVRRSLDADAGADVACVRDDAGMLWREDATNAHTDRFRTFVRHQIVPLARERNPRLEETLCRSMNLIADEDDMLQDMADALLAQTVAWIPANVEQGMPEGCTVAPSFAQAPVPLQRRVAAALLQRILGDDERVETASVEAVTAAFANGVPVSGYTGNIQGNLALSANKRGLRIEPMEAYRARRKRQ